MGYIRLTKPLEAIEDSLSLSEDRNEHNEALDKWMRVVNTAIRENLGMERVFQIDIPLPNIKMLQLIELVLCCQQAGWKVQTSSDRELFCMHLNILP